MHQLDFGLTLHRQPHGGLVALGPGAADDFAARLVALLGRERAPRLAGRSQYVSITTADGAPAVGRVGDVGPDLLAGFGFTGAFFAPAIARWLCDRASGAERSWFEARLVGRSVSASPPAEFRGAA